jgi:thioredoxin-dependent peroxiredoxin
MRKLVFTAILSTAVSSIAFAALQKGDAAPDFTAQASMDGKAFTYKLSDALKEGAVVVYFYPSAYTQGCNIQAHEFAQNVEKFQAADATIIGVSLDSIQRLNDFSADPAYCAGKIAVASDADGSIAKSYELMVRDAPAQPIQDTRGVAIDHGFAERTTFIVTSDGKVAETIGGVSPVENVAKALEAVQRLGHGAH